MPQPEDLVQFAIKKLLPRSIKRQFANRWKIASSDGVVVSFPKCGRTWLRMMLTMYYGERYALRERPLLEFANLHYLDSRIPKIFFTHDESSKARPRDFNTDKVAYQRSPVIFLHRDPRDAIVSQYFHRLKRDGDIEASPFEFAMREDGGLRTAIEFFNMWRWALERIPQHMLLAYEEMRNRPAHSLSRVLQFFGEEVDSNCVDAAVQQSAFEEMKAIERSHGVSSPRLQPRDVDDDDSYKVRRGKVGGYIDYFSDKEIGALDSLVRKYLVPFFDYA